MTAGNRPPVGGAPLGRVSVAAEIEPGGGNDDRLVAGIREDARPRRRCGEVGAHHVDPLRRHTDADQAAVETGGEACRQVASGIGEDQLVPSNVEKSGAKLHALFPDRADADGDFRLWDDIETKLGAGRGTGQAAGERHV